MTPSPWEHFYVEELRCRCGCGRMDMDNVFMSRLVLLRKAAGFPFPITSAFRCMAHDLSIGGARVHPTGHAVDIGLYGERALIVVSLALSHGMRGIGIDQKGDRSKRFIHLDDLDQRKFPGHPRPWVWSY